MKDHEGWRFHLDICDYQGYIGVYLAQMSGNQRSEVISCNMETIDRESVSLALQNKLPPLKIDKKAAQELMDELYRIGIRPTDADTPGELAATKRHLEDMKAIVFDYMAELRLASDALRERGLQLTPLGESLRRQRIDLNE